MAACRSLVALSWLFVIAVAGGCSSSASGLRDRASVPGMGGDALPAHDMNGVSGGREDHENLWRTIVRIRSGMGNCSGVLIANKMVLTAAHCFCPVTRAAFDRKSCVKNATIISHWYLYRSKEQGWESIPESSPGTVIVHEGFTSQRDDQGAIDPGKRVADLAMVVLEHELKGSR